MSDLTIGVLATIAGTVVGGGIAFLLEHQRQSFQRSLRIQSSQDRVRESLSSKRFDACVEYFGATRSFRNAIRNRTQLLESAHASQADWGHYLDVIADAYEKVATSISAVLVAGGSAEYLRCVEELYNSQSSILKLIWKRDASALGRELNDLLGEHANLLKQAERVARSDYQVLMTDAHSLNTIGRDGDTI